MDLDVLHKSEPTSGSAAQRDGARRWNEDAVTVGFGAPSSAPTGLQVGAPPGAKTIIHLAPRSSSESGRPRESSSSTSWSPTTVKQRSFSTCYRHRRMDRSSRIGLHDPRVLRMHESLTNDSLD